MFILFKTFWMSNDHIYKNTVANMHVSVYRQTLSRSLPWRLYIVKTNESRQSFMKYQSLCLKVCYMLFCCSSKQMMLVWRPAWRHQTRYGAISIWKRIQHRSIGCDVKTRKGLSFDSFANKYTSIALNGSMSRWRHFLVMQLTVFIQSLLRSFALLAFTASK